MELVPLFVRVPETVRRELKIRAAKEGVSVQVLVARLLRAGLKNPGKEA